MSKPRIGLFLYFPLSFGGGERFLLTAAESLRALGDVDVLCPTPAELGPFEKAFGLDLEGVRFVHLPWRRLQGYRDWFSRGRYDLFFALDNHLAPMQVCLGRTGALILQTPPYEPPFHTPLRSRWKLRMYDRVVCYSEYIRRHAVAHGTAGRPVQVLHPPIDLDLYVPGPKRRAILSVGRFFVGRHQKRHRVMLDAFRRLRERGAEDVELWLAGSIRHYEPEHLAYLEGLREEARDLPVRFFVDASLEEMRRLYAEASLYWHAAGHGVDERATPQFVEHFGMAIAEAMAAGAIPLVFPVGGPLEIVTPGRDGEFWETPDDLADRSLALLAERPEALEARRVACRRAVVRFGKPAFVGEIRALAEELLAS